MAPLRRYLRITKYSVLECRIYLDNPALAQSWLLNPRNPILPKVIESVRHLVLPKLREEKERERTKKKSSKKKSIKDVVVQEHELDEFEVSMFLTETSTRHSLLTKHKHFRDKATNKLQSNSNKLISETNDAPIDLDMEAEGPGATVHIREESDPEDSPGGLSQIPAVDETSRPRRSKRQRGEPRDADTEYEMPSDDDAGAGASAIEIDSEDDVFPPPKRIKKQKTGSDVEQDDDKKKMAMDVSYEGFAIYGRVLCLVVKKRQRLRLAASSGSGNGKQPAGQASMENWISSTQMPNPGAEEDAS
ncbi:hypothetical protein CT0861_00548 [Colletotrichum tofieldiae]|uniref:Uncharacterized protein n=1 Tax=Colletotrichum tofieldiae TaxID=708197 RepID=A0A166V972_9PEZI|nr:hypothetical protein CT0861_00548 [Colletotrichum tofieldiae]GKT91574.1 hypothetical protein Ct61P_09424 [Colletotrichum tofieldiae]